MDYLMVVLMAAAIPAIFAHGASTAIWTTNTFFATLFCFINIAQRSKKHCRNKKNNNQICHHQFAPLNAYSLAKFLSDFLHR